MKRSRRKRKDKPRNTCQSGRHEMVRGAYRVEVVQSHGRTYKVRRCKQCQKERTVRWLGIEGNEKPYRRPEEQYKLVGETGYETPWRPVPPSGVLRGPRAEVRARLGQTYGAVFRRARGPGSELSG